MKTEGGKKYTSLAQESNLERRPRKAGTAYAVCHLNMLPLHQPGLPASNNKQFDIRIFFSPALPDRGPREKNSPDPGRT
jgi:hypothetical protein